MGSPAGRSPPRGRKSATRGTLIDIEHGAAAGPANGDGIGCRQSPFPPLMANHGVAGASAPGQWDETGLLLRHLRRWAASSKALAFHEPPRPERYVGLLTTDVENE